jgi:RND superfamily putative drug exporter
VKIVPIVLLVIALLLAIRCAACCAAGSRPSSSYLASLGFAIVVLGKVGRRARRTVLPFFMFVFLMALGSDYNILATRIRGAQRRPLREARHTVVDRRNGHVGWLALATSPS